MADDSGWLGGLLGGGGSSTLDLYGDLFTDAQKKALQQREMTQGLFRMAEKLGALAQPSRAPPGLGGTLGALGAGLGAFGSGGTAEETALKGMQTAEAVRKSKQERAFAAQFMPLLQGLYAKEQQFGLPKGTLTSLVPTAAAPGAPAPSSNAPPPPPGSPPIPAPPPAGDFGAAGEYGGGQVPPALTPPPGYENDINRVLSQPSAGQQNTGLLGAPDEVVGPDGRPLPRGLLALNGGGIPLPQYTAMGTGGMPGGPLPFRLASAATQTPGVDGGLSDAEWLRQNAPFPTQGRRGPQPPAAGGAYAQGFTYGEPKVPLGQSPDDVAPGGGPLGPAVETARRPVAGPLDLIEKYESGGRNIKQQVIGPEGGYNPSVGRVTGPSSASGYYQMTDPTWRAAAAKTGVDTEKYPTAMSAPKEVQRQVAQTLFDQEGYKPWAPYNSRLAAAVGGQDTVIPSGRGIPASALRTVADTGGGPGGAAPSGLVPGLNTTPQGLAILNSMAKLSGLGDPFNSLLETYYKSPGYLAEKARTEAQATKDVEYKMDPLILEQKKRAEYKVDMELKPRLEEAVQKLQSPILKERAQAQADIDRITKEMEQAGAAALRPNDATVIGPGGALTTQKLTDLEFAKRQQARAERAAKGDTTFQPGDIVGTPVGAAPAEHQYIVTPQGALSAVPVPGTPAAEKATELANKKLQTEQQRLIGRDVVVSEVANIKNEMATASLPTTGLIGSWLQNTGDTAANNIRVARQTIEARMSTDAINAMRAASPTGAALGNASDADLAILRTAIANLDQSQGKAQFLQRLDRVQQLYIDAVHGPGASRLLPETPVLKTPGGAAAQGPAAAARANAADAIARGAPRDVVIKRLQDAGISIEGL